MFPPSRNQRRLLERVNALYDLELEIPDALKIIQLSEKNRRLVVISVQGLRRVNGSLLPEYTPEEFQEATFSFVKYYVQGPPLRRTGGGEREAQTGFEQRDCLAQSRLRYLRPDLPRHPPSSIAAPWGGDGHFFREHIRGTSHLRAAPGFIRTATAQCTTAVSPQDAARSVSSGSGPACHLPQTVLRLLFFCRRLCYNSPIEDMDKEDRPMRVLAAMLAAWMLVALSACAQPQDQPDPQPEPDVQEEPVQPDPPPPSPEELAAAPN